MRLYLATCVILVASLMPSASAFASPPAEDETPSDSKASLSFAPLPIIFYTPETKTAIGGAANIFRRPAGATEDTRPSTLTPLLIYSFEKQIIAIVSGNHYWDDEKHNANASLSYIKFPGSFFGIGNDTSIDGDEDYTTETYGANVGYLRRVRSHLRLGGDLSYGHSTLLSSESGGRLDSGTIVGADGGSILGVGVRLDFDDRNHVTYPTAGGWTTLGVQVFDGALGSDYDFRAMQLESRRYSSVGPSRAIAVRFLANHVDGDAPFQVLPALGGDSILRGYFGGRYRDRDLLSFDAEFRQHVWWRLGLVAFAGAGQVAHNPGDFAMNRFHTAAGFGLRVRFIEAEQLNIRFDFGWGEDDSGSYISLGEAF